ncbi:MULTISPECIES: TolC family protein [Emticicia]|uniref:TolC family protein n=1 Tax=Emticicia TaxID=312278 RepID=UPI0007D8C555|nr:MULTISPECIES: TolC family protein [Emticicia]
MKNLRIYIALVLGFLLENQSTFAQTTPTYSLEQLSEIAIKSNKGLAIKQLQIEEKRIKVKEDEIKRLPVVNLSSTYQYNVNLANITIPAGAIGVIPMNATTQVPLPNTDKNITVGSNNNYNIGLTAYMPLTQQAKIKMGIEVSKVENQVSEKEKLKVSLQLKHGIEQLYYATLIAQKQQEEAQAKLNLANNRLNDLENAITAGKTLDLNKAGILASIADEEQNILKFDFQIQNYKADIAKLAGLPNEDFSLTSTLPVVNNLSSITDYKSGISTNPDVQIANLNKYKTEVGFKAAKLSDRPDIGLVTGYAYQSGNPLAPANNPFIGVNLKWNLQDLYANKQIQKQRALQMKQAEENIDYTQEQLLYEIEKAYRKAQQSKSLINVAEKALKYRQEELKLQEDKQLAGMNLKTDILATKAVLAKAEADVYAAKLAYLIALSDLDALIGQ